MTKAELYHCFANDCLRDAERADNPKQRALLLKLAAEWLIATQQIYEASTESKPQNLRARPRKRRNFIGKSDEHPNLPLPPASPPGRSDS